MIQDKPTYEALERTNTILNAQLNQRTQEISMIRTVQEGLVKKLDLQSIYDLVGDQIRDTFDAQAVFIATFDHEAGVEHFWYAIEKGERFQLKSRQFDKLRQNLLDTKQRILINENIEEAYRQFGMRVLPGTDFPKSALFVPLIIGEKATGYLSLQNIDKENAFSESDVFLLETLASSMSSALENAHLLKETEQRTAELAVINSVQDALAKEMDIQAIYDLVGNRIRELFDAQAVGIGTFDNKTGTENIHYLIEKGERYYPAPRPLNILRKHLIATREKILINKNFDEVAATFGLKKVPGTEQPKSAVYVPLVIGERVTGFISLQNIDRENAFSDSDVRLLETLANSMGVALENARLFDETTRLLKETEQQKAELGVINSVQEGLSKELDIQAIYDLVGNRIRELFNAQAVIIATFEHDTATEQFKYLIEDGQRFYLPPRPYDKLRQHLIITKQKIVINENYAEAYAKFGLKTLPGTNVTKSAVFVPLVIGDKVNSYISLQNNEIEKAFSESDVRLLETLANSMSVALENARLFDETTRLLKETEQRTAELAVINSVQEGLARELDMDAIYDLVGNKIREVFDAQVVMISTFDHESGTEKFNYLIEKGERFFPEPRRYDKLRYQLIMSKQRILINNNVTEALKEFGLKVVQGTEAPKSALYVPLIVGNNVTSYVSLQNLDKENAFSESDVRLLETLANSMSVALENARLFDETNRLLKETEQQKGELSVITSVQDGLAKELEIQSIYELVGEKIREIFDAQIIDIATYDAARNKLIDQYAYEKGDRTLVGEWEPIGFRKIVIETADVLLINENLSQRKAEAGSQVLSGEQPLSCLFVPLKTGQEVKGMISLQDLDKEHAFSESDVRLLETLANSMSVALESARLFDETNRLLKETEQRNAELAVINSVQESLVAQLDIKSIYELVGEKIRNIFDAQVIDIVTYDPEKKLIEDQYSYEKGDRTLVGPREPRGFRKHVIEKSEIFIINENMHQAAIDYDSPVVIGEMPKSLLMVPMIATGKIKGMISLQNLDHEHAFSVSNVSLLITLANSMSVALESARLFDETNRLLKETEQRNAELAVINSVQESLVAQLDIKSIYELVGEKIRNIFDAQVIDIVTYNPLNNIIEDQYAYEKGDRTLLGPREPKGFRKHVIETGELLLTNENVEQALIEFDNPILIGDIPKSQIYVPMIAGGKVKGIISLQNLDHEQAFPESNVSLLITLANSMSVALESARLFDETTRLLKETGQRNAELAVITSVQENLVAQMDMQGIYELVGEKMREIFYAQVIDIVTYDKKSDLIEDKYSYEKGDRTLLGKREPKGFRKHVLTEGQILIINKDVEKHRPKYDNTVVVGEPAKSIVMVPMVVGGEVTGVISLQNLDQENAFSDSDINLLNTLVNSMSVALKSARLFDETVRLLNETEQRTAELAVINSVQEGLVREMDMQAIYELVGNRLCNLFPDTQTLVIRTFDHVSGNEQWQYAIEKGVRLYSKPRPFNWANQRLINTMQPLHINKDYVETAKKFGGTGVTKGTPPKSAVFVPMVVGDVVKGSVSLQNVDIENAFTESDVRLLTTLTNSMSVALENARLFDETHRLLKETEQRTAELAVINSVQEGLVREIDMSAIYQTVGDRLCTLFNIQTVVIRTFDHESGLETWRYAIEKGEKLYSDPRPFNWANKQLISSRRPLIINKDYVETAKKFGGAGVTKGQPPKSAVFVPMVVGDVVKGSVSLQNVDIENAFSEADIRLLTTLTNSMSVALENARLFDETNRLLGEAKQRASELTTVNNISKAIASQLNPTDLIQLVGEQLKDLFNANIVYLALLDQKTQTVYFPYQFGDELKPMKLGEGLTSQIILTGDSLLINRNIQEFRKQLGVSMLGIPAASYLGVPIPVGDEHIGVLSVQSTEQENRFNENDKRLLSTIAASVGVALRNAKLFEDVQLAKNEAEAASKAAEKANEAKSAFLSTVSHELRTPLTSVLGFTKIIRKRLDEKIFPVVNQDDPKTGKVIKQINENLNVVIAEGERLTHLINDVLDLAKIEAGKMEWNMEDVSMTEVAERAMAATSSLFETKPLKLRKYIDKDLPKISGDRDKLIQVIINLISNSVKFTDSGTVSCNIYQKHAELIVEIEDTGIGIANEDFDAVFEQFKQVGGDTLTDKPKGTGLGLPICKEIIEHHGGRIWLESKVGEGSKFSFALPAVKESTTQPLHLNHLIKQLKEQMSHSSFKVIGSNSTILVVDDDDSIRSLLNQELTEAGYNIEEASNGKEALEKIRLKRPDLVILDVMMPEMNGFDVAAILKNDPSTMDIPIIVLSIVQDKARGFRIGVDRYLTKPINTAELFTEVGSLLDQGKSKRKVLVVDEDSTAVRSLSDVLEAKGYNVVESDGTEIVQQAIDSQPDIIILNSDKTGRQELMKTIRFEKGLENVLFLMYQ
jgi:GAF domain-containing protein/DNA-binding response OmpR family regulator